MKDSYQLCGIERLDKLDSLHAKFEKIKFKKKVTKKVTTIRSPSRYLVIVLELFMAESNRSNDEIAQIWARFVETATAIPLINDVTTRREKALELREWTKILTENGYYRRTQERYSLFEKLYCPCIFYQYKGFEIMEHHVQEYLIAKHAIDVTDDLNNLKAEIVVDDKCNVLCDIFNRETNSTMRFRVLLNDSQVNGNEMCIKKRPSSRELFAIKLIELLGVGPEVHLVVPPNGGTDRHVFIVTKEVAGLVLLGELGTDGVSINAILKLHLLTRILSLIYNDVTDSGMFGEEPKIIGFRIDEQYDYYQPKLFEEFVAGKLEHDYCYPMPVSSESPPKSWMAYAMNSSSRCDKLDILKNALLEWQLLEKLDMTMQEFDNFKTEYKGKVLFNDERDNDDFCKYVKGVKKTVETLLAKAGPLGLYR